MEIGVLFVSWLENSTTPGAVFMQRICFLAENGSDICIVSFMGVVNLKFPRLVHVRDRGHYSCYYNLCSYEHTNNDILR